MRVSEFYGLGVDQPALEFLDVDVRRDTRVFVDPHAFRSMSTDWARECVTLIQDFYGEVLDAIRRGDSTRGSYLLSQLGESNEAHLGLSSDESHGSGIAGGLAADIFQALSSSKAVLTGLMSDIEETVLFVDGIGHDRVSDMTISIVRRQLIEFTQLACDRHGIPLVDDVDSGPMWNRQAHQWEARHTRLPMPNGKLLMVPKGVVRKTATFDPGDYLTHFVLPYLQQIELGKAQSNIVEERTSRARRGERYVTKKAIRDRDGQRTKDWNFDVTDGNPQLLEDYRAAKSELTEPPGHDDIAVLTQTPYPDWDALLAAFTSVPPGPDGADDYHRAIQNLLTALFYPALDMPFREFKINQGRKRIDIVYANVAESGYFHWLDRSGGVPCGIIVVECKNYTGAIANPEFDQLTGRFSPRRGKVGLLCYRGFGDDKAAVIARCRDAALDDLGIVIALDDSDLEILIEARKHGESTMFKHLMQRHLELV